MDDECPWLYLTILTCYKNVLHNTSIFVKVMFLGLNGKKKVFLLVSVESELIRVYIWFGSCAAAGQMF